MALDGLPPDSIACEPRIANGSQKLAWTRWSMTSFGTVGASSFVGVVVGVMVVGSLARFFAFRASVSSPTLAMTPDPPQPTCPLSDAREFRPWTHPYFPTLKTASARSGRWSDPRSGPTQDRVNVQSRLPRTWSIRTQEFCDGRV